MAKANRSIRARDDEEASMGIGTMIVFIAMVLVAAVAATLLIRTAYIVQQQATQTGIDAITDVAAGYKIIEVVGDRKAECLDTAANSSAVQVIMVKVTVNAGSPGVNMDDTLVSVSDGATEGTLTYSNLTSATTDNEYATGATSSVFTAKKLRDPKGAWDDNDDQIVSWGTVVQLYIDIGDLGLSLTTQETGWIRIIPRNGVPTYEEFTTPSSFSERYLQLH